MKCPSCFVDLLPGSQICASCKAPALTARLAAAPPFPLLESDDETNPARGRQRLSAAAARDANSAAHRSTPDTGPAPPTFSSTDSRFPPGAVLLGRYRIVGRIDRGPDKEIYRADDLKLGETVALRFLTRDLEQDDTARQRLQEEMKITWRVSHPNICRIYGADEIDGLPFLSMEYIDGEDLASLLRRVGQLPPAKVVEIGCQVCQGLQAAHEQGVLSLDLQPAHLMIDNIGQARLTHFTYLVGQATPVASWPRTAAYMAPEQHAGQQVSPRTDLYALGLVLYEALTGRPVFTGNDREEIARLHLAARPIPLSRIVMGIDAVLEDTLHACLEKDPARRPSSAAELDRSLAASARRPRPTPRAATPPGADAPSIAPTARQRVRRPSLRVLPTAKIPDQPYPVLLPYTHPDLLAGREQEIATLQRLLRAPTPILGLYAPSGTGKSSLLLAGLLPELRQAGQAVAIDHNPQEPGLAARLIGDLLEPSQPLTDHDWRGFLEQLREVERLTELPPILVIDQFESLLHSTTSSANAAAVDARRAALGVLLAATARRQPGASAPICRWLLAYRQEFHGEAVAWLRDVLSDAQAAGVAGLRALPDDLSTPERFQAVPLMPLASPNPGDDALVQATRVFRAAIEKPLSLEDAGRPRYRWRFAADDAERLARTFAEARLARPDAPLVPELQVVLAHLIAQADADGVLCVPTDAATSIDRALENHLHRALDQAFPNDRQSHDLVTGRTRALLALRELARAREGLPAAALARAIGDAGKEVLEALATPLTRLIVMRDTPQGQICFLSHDRMAEVVVGLAEEQKRYGKLVIDPELLALGRFVALKTALHHLREPQATRLPRRYFRRIAANTEALLWDDERRAWWRACQKRRRADSRRRLSLAAAAIFALTLVGWGAWTSARQRAQHRALRELLTDGEPAVALRALDQLMASPKADPDDLRALLKQRKIPMDVLENGLGGIADGDRGAMVLRAVELALPWVTETPEDPTLIANLVWSIDFAPGRDPDLAQEAAALRVKVLGPLHRLRPPPPLPAPDDQDWVQISPGNFLMGAPSTDRPDDDEQPVHRVTLRKPFRILRHEITRAQYQRLMPDTSPADDFPADNVTWYEAYTYAAWRGGRLPTEAEWEYAARAGCQYAYCASDGSEAKIEQVAWTLRNANDSKNAHPVMRRTPNPWGLYDMLGNVWEWTADIYDLYAEEPSIDPWGPSHAEDGARRVLRGGASSFSGHDARFEGRLRMAPGFVSGHIGFRMVIPASAAASG